MLLKLSFKLAKKNKPQQQTNNKAEQTDKKTTKKQDRLYTYEENMDDGVKFQNQAGCFPRMMKAFAKQNACIGNNN